MKSDAIERDAVLEAVIRIAREAGALVMQVYATDFAVRGKEDASPVTQADERAEALIVPALAALLPSVPVVAEEAVAKGEIPAVGNRFWLVDPLDGTKEFISRNGEFTVNIALVEDGVPTLGVVFAPAIGRLFAGAAGLGARVEDSEGRRPITCRAVPAEGLTVVASRSHGDETALAAGEADLYPRLGRTMEWDIAAGHAVVLAAGGQVCRLDGTPLAYGKPGFDNPHFYATGSVLGA